MSNRPDKPVGASKRECAKCRDVKKWSPREDVNGDGVFWHWCLEGLSAADIASGCTTALAQKCMEIANER